MLTKMTRRIYRYPIALAAVVAAYYLRAGMVRLVGDHLPPYILFFPTVMVVSLMSGLEMGVLATVASVALVYFCILPAGPATGADLVAMALFVANNLFISVVAEMYRRGRDQMEEQVKERTAALARANEELSRESETRRQALEEMRKSEEKLAKAFRASPDGVLISRLADGLFIEPSDKWLAMFGYTREEVIGRTSFELKFFVDPGERDRLKAALVEQGFLRDFEMTLRRKAGDLLGNSGVGLAGDAFDARIVRKLVSPALGADSMARSGKKILPAVPAWIYANLERWHYLSFLRTRSVMELLQGARVRALEPEKIAALITLVDEDLGYQLHQAVQRVKFELSQSEHSEFRFRDGGLDLRRAVARAEFESWIGDDLHKIEQCVDGLLASSGVDARTVDRVFLTGGTSFVPAVRRIFERRFTAERVRSGNEFTSVASGLALRAQEARE